MGGRDNENKKGGEGGQKQTVCTISKSLQRACRGEFLVREKRPSHFSLRAPSEVWRPARKLAVLQPPKTRST
jgi:hypothetical protein